MGKNRRTKNYWKRAKEKEIDHAERRRDIEAETSSSPEPSSEQEQEAS